LTRWSPRETRARIVAAAADRFSGLAACARNRQHGPGSYALTSPILQCVTELATPIMAAAVRQWKS